MCHMQSRGAVLWVLEFPVAHVAHHKAVAHTARHHMTQTVSTNEQKLNYPGETHNERRSPTRLGCPPGCGPASERQR